MGKVTMFFDMVAATAIALFVGFVVVNTMTSITYQEGYTARYSAYQQGMTQRVQAEQQGATARWQATTAAAPWVVGGAGLTAVLVVAAVQWGRTRRHGETEETRRRALLVLYARQYLPDSRTEITHRGGELVIIDHDSREVIPEHVALLGMRQPQLPG